VENSTDILYSWAVLQWSPSHSTINRLVNNNNNNIDNNLHRHYFCTVQVQRQYHRPIYTPRVSSFSHAREGASRAPIKSILVILYTIDLALCGRMCTSAVVYSYVRYLQYPVCIRPSGWIRHVGRVADSVRPTVRCRRFAGRVPELLLPDIPLR